MKKTTLKITTFFLLTMFVFQVQGQIDETKVYNLRCFGTGNYIKSNNTSTYVTSAFIADDIGLNFKFNIAEAGATDYNINHNSYRGIMRGAGTLNVVHTTFQPNTSGGLATDKRWVASTLVQSGFTTYRFEISSGSTERYLYEGTDGLFYNITVADMNDAAITYTDGELRSYWLLEESPITLSSKDFDASSLFISNPVNNQLVIKGLPSNVKQVSVYSLLGKRVLSRIVDQKPSLSLDTSVLSSGLYIVKISTDNASISRKIVKQ